MRILVTGHRGYIGGHLYRKLVRLGYEVDGIDLKNGEDILHCLPNKNYDYVFHLAALPRVEFSVENPSYTLKQTVLVTSTLLDWSLTHIIKKFISLSSSAAIGDGNGPKSPYGLHKFISEMECRLYSDLYKLDTTCLRYFNAYSEDQQYGGSYSTAICAWMEMIRKNKPLRFDGDGEQTRDLVHVEDIVNANIFLMKEKIKQPENFLNGKIFEVGSGESVSMNYIKNFIDNNHSVKWNHVPTRPGDVRHTLADITALKKDGWEPSISIKEGLTRCVKKEA